MLEEIFWDLSKSCDKWNLYFAAYETYFSRFVGQSPIVVEVGVQSGGSLEMWQKYFGEGARILGVDCDPSVRNNSVPGTEIIIGDQASPAFWRDFFTIIDGVDVFIDDGGHMMVQQMIAFDCVFPMIRKGGVYLCEDTHTSYQSFYGGKLYGETFVEYAKKFADIVTTQQDIDENLLKIADGLSSVHFHNSMVFFVKDAQPFARVVSTQR